MTALILLTGAAIVLFVVLGVAALTRLMYQRGRSAVVGLTDTPQSLSLLERELRRVAALPRGSTGTDAHMPLPQLAR